MQCLSYVLLRVCRTSCLKVHVLCAATLWGQDSLWLHVDADNDAALRLYAAAGFALASEDSRGWFGLPRRRLLYRQLRPRGMLADPSSESMSAKKVSAVASTEGTAASAVVEAVMDRGSNSEARELEEMSDEAPAAVASSVSTGHGMVRGEQACVSEVRGGQTYVWDLGE